MNKRGVPSNEQGEKRKTEDSDLQAAKITREYKRTETKDIFEVLKRYDTYISQANSKASFLISIIGIGVVLLIANHQLILNMTECTRFPWLNVIILGLIGVALLLSLLLSLLVVFPLTWGGEKHGEYISYIAYSSVAKMTYDVFQGHHSSETYDLWTDLIRQTYIVARILNIKFLQLKFAVGSSIVAVFLFAVLFYVIPGVK